MPRIALLMLLLFSTLLSLPATAAVPCRNPTVGMECDFEGFRFGALEPELETITATCRLISTKLVIFVQNGKEGTATVERLQTLVNAFETATPANSEQGILRAAKNYGSLPATPDNDDRVYLVVGDITNNAPNPVTAYFREKDIELDHGEPLEGSNQHKVIFLEVDNFDSDQRQGDLARETLNLTHYGFDANEEEWIKDILARKFVVELGFDSYLDPVAQFAQSPNKPLVSDDPDHGATTLFGIYLSEVFESLFFVSWLQDDTNGMAGFEEKLGIGGGLYNNFCDYFHEWATFNGLNMGDYAYHSIQINDFNARFIQNHPGTVADSLVQYAASYIEIDVSDVQPEDDFEVTYEVADTTGVRVTAARINRQGMQTGEIGELTINAGQPTLFHFDDAGESYDTIVLISSRCAPADPMLYTITTRVIEPVQPDGDESPDGDTVVTDGDSESSDGDSTDGDVTIDGDAEAEADTSTPIIEGSLSCPEVNECYLDAANSTEQQDCVDAGTNLAQRQWAAYVACISGEKGGQNCLSLETVEEREACMITNCTNDELKVCGINIVDPGDNPEDLGGSSCAGFNGTHNHWLWLLLLAAFVLRQCRQRMKA